MERVADRKDCLCSHRDRSLRHVRDAHNVERLRKRFEGNDPPGQILRHTFLFQPSKLLAQALAVLVVQGSRHIHREVCDAIAIPRNLRLEAFFGTAMPQKPRGLLAKEILNFSIKRELLLAVDFAVQRVDAGINRLQLINGHRRREGIGDIFWRVPRLFDKADDEGGAAAVDDVVCQAGCNNLAPKLMIFNFSREPFPHERGKIIEKGSAKIRVVRNGRLNKIIFKIDLRIGQKHSEFGAGQGLTGFLTLQDRRIRRQRFQCSVETAPVFEPLHKALLKAKIREPILLGEAYGKCLQIIVAKDGAGDFIGHRSKKLVARRGFQLTRRDGSAERNLDVDLDVGRIDARRIVDGVGVQFASEKRELDAAALRYAKVGAFADNLSLQVVGCNADRVIGPVACLGVRLAAAAYIGADAAKPQKIDRRFDDRGQQFVRCNHGFKPEQLLCLDRKRDVFLAPAVNGATG